MTSICASPGGPVGASRRARAPPTRSAPTWSVPASPAAARAAARSTRTAARCAGRQCDVATAALQADPDQRQDALPTRRCQSSTLRPINSRSRTNLEPEARTTLYYATNATADDAQRRYPLVANDIAFVPTAARPTSPRTAPTPCSSVDVRRHERRRPGRRQRGACIHRPRPRTRSAAQKWQNPIGIAIGARAHAFAFVANDVSRNVTAVDLRPQIVAGSGADPSVCASPRARRCPRRRRASRAARQALLQHRPRALVAQGAGLGRVPELPLRRPERQRDLVLRARAAPVDEPRRQLRQDRSDRSAHLQLDGRLRRGRRLREHRARPDAAASARLVSDQQRSRRSTPIASTSATRRPIRQPERAACNGSPRRPPSDASVLKDWDDMKASTSRACARRARRPTSTPTLVAAGKTLFEDAATGGRCQGCHGGAKWTVSRALLHADGRHQRGALHRRRGTAPRSPARFPAALLPAAAGSQFMRAPTPSAAGTIRSCACSGRSAPSASRRPPSAWSSSPGHDHRGPGRRRSRQRLQPALLGLQVGAPFFHAGNARTLEELLSTTFAAHNGALAGLARAFSAERRRRQLVAFLLSIDGARRR